MDSLPFFLLAGDTEWGKRTFMNSSGILQDSIKDQAKKGGQDESDKFEKNVIGIGCGAGWNRSAAGLFRESKKPV